MTKPIPDGHEGLIPHLICTPAADALEYYKKAFGAEEVHRMPSITERIVAPSSSNPPCVLAAHSRDGAS